MQKKLMQKRERFVEGSKLHRKLHFGLIALLLGSITLTADVCAGQQPDAPAPQPEAVAKQKAGGCPKFANSRSAAPFNLAGRPRPRSQE